MGIVAYLLEINLFFYLWPLTVSPYRVNNHTPNAANKTAHT